MRYTDIKIIENVVRVTRKQWDAMSNADKICYALCASFAKHGVESAQDVIAAKQGANDFLTYSTNAQDNTQVKNCLDNFTKPGWCSGNGNFTSGSGQSSSPSGSFGSSTDVGPTGSSTVRGDGDDSTSSSAAAAAAATQGA